MHEFHFHNSINSNIITGLFVIKQLFSERPNATPKDYSIQQ
jgi:hypothetical protein